MLILFYSLVLYPTVSYKLCYSFYQSKFSFEFSVLTTVKFSFLLSQLVYLWLSFFVFLQWLTPLGLLKELEWLPLHFPVSGIRTWLSAQGSLDIFGRWSFPDQRFVFSSKSLPLPWYLFVLKIVLPCRQNCPHICNPSGSILPLLGL